MNKQRIKSLINKTNPVIFEIGCADGLDTLEFIQTFGDSDFKMFCFEPEPRNIKKFKNTIKDNRVTLVEKAIGNTDNQLTLYQSNTEYSSSLLKPAPKLFSTWPFIKFENSFNVEVTKLDTFMKEEGIDLIDFIWADVQGAEDLMILGGLDALSKTRFLYTEYAQEDDEIYLGQKGLNKLLGLLPNFDLVQDFKSDVLLKNKNL
jgi:FkbM family methyltransferase